MTRVLFAGEAPSRRSDPRYPFCGASGNTLAVAAGFDNYAALRQRAEFRNLLQRWPGNGYAGEKGSRFPLRRARRAAERMPLGGFAVVVLVGRRVARAFALDHLSPFELHSHLGLRLATIPHPSGCNRFYHSSSNRALLAAFLRSLFAARAQAA